MDDESAPVPDEVLEQKLERVVADAVSQRRDADHLDEEDWKTVLTAWQQLTQLQGTFSGIEETTVFTGEESDAVSDRFDGKVVEGTAQFGSVGYTLRLFCDTQGSASGFRIVRTEPAGVSGAVKDVGGLVESKLSGLIGGDGVSEADREEINSIVADLEAYRFQSVYERFTDAIRTQVRAQDIRSAWMEYASDFVEIEEIQSRRELIEVTLRLEEGESTLLLQFTEDRELSTFRIE